MTNSVPIPVLIAGGPAGSSTEDILQIVYDPQAGGGGVCMVAKCSLMKTLKLWSQR